MKQADYTFRVNKENVSFEREEFVKMLQQSGKEGCRVCACTKNDSPPYCKCEQCKCCKHMYHKPAFGQPPLACATANCILASLGLKCVCNWYD